MPNCLSLELPSLSSRILYSPGLLLTFNSSSLLGWVFQPGELSRSFLRTPSLPVSTHIVPRQTWPGCANSKLQAFVSAQNFSFHLASPLGISDLNLEEVNSGFLSTNVFLHLSFSAVKMALTPTNCLSPQCCEFLCIPFPSAAL